MQLDVIQLGRLWSLFRDEYPRHELQPVLPAVFERFDLPSSDAFQIGLDLAQPQARCWFLSQDETRLIQVQADRFLLNWRKVRGQGIYPRYEKMRDLFLKAVEAFRGFIRSEGLGDLTPNQCEVTYVNHLEQGKGWMRPSEVAAIFPGFTGHWSSGFLPAPEDVRAALRWVIPGAAEAQPVGRLHVQIEPRYRRDNQPALLSMTLTSRTRPLGPEVDGAMRSLDLGREWIVKGFADLTSKAMHKLWERVDG